MGREWGEADSGVPVDPWGDAGRESVGGESVERVSVGREFVEPGLLGREFVEPEFVGYEFVEREFVGYEVEPESVGRHALREEPVRQAADEVGFAVPERAVDPAPVPVPKHAAARAPEPLPKRVPAPVPTPAEIAWMDRAAILAGVEMVDSWEFPASRVGAHARAAR
ncbi:hypothetical protein [Saccharothrix hoggarensis]|uniref:Uncharacterized protein n=1 Tax=Saccharothrix hoggarensis TaxID=913853 RepID=A0ABW3QVB6_9PSEU